MRRERPPFELEIEALGRGATGRGRDDQGRPVDVRNAPPGSRLLVVPTTGRAGRRRARRIAMIRPPAAWVEPRCPLFLTCGGCSLQELALEVQRDLRAAGAVRDVAAGIDVSRARVHPPRSAGLAYGYRNRLELSFGVRRWLETQDRDVPIDGRWLGFHAPERFDRVVDADSCPLAPAATNAAIRVVRAIALAEDAPPPWDSRDHTGFWRYLLVRENARGEVLAGLFTATPVGDEERWIERIAAAARVRGLVWLTSDGVADVARGEVRRVFGEPTLDEELGGVGFRLSVGSFFQTSTAGARILYDTVGEAVGSGGTLLDLYCGVGAIGLVLAGRFDRVVGVDEVPDAIADATANAARAGITHAGFHCARVEDALTILDESGPPRTIVVDPPRAGLHPKVSGRLSTADADVLTYVACNPSSLARDGAVLVSGGWVLTDLWTVDLFPQTAHVEAIARFVRPTGVSGT